MTTDDDLKRAEEYASQIYSGAYVAFPVAMANGDILTANVPVEQMRCVVTSAYLAGLEAGRNETFVICRQCEEKIHALMYGDFVYSAASKGPEGEA